jgi:hypothetical protein
MNHNRAIGKGLFSVAAIFFCLLRTGWAAGLNAATPCPVFLQIEAEDTAPHANRMVEMADAGALLGLIRLTVRAEAAGAAAARREIAGATNWCAAHRAGRLGEALAAGSATGERGAVAGRAAGAVLPERAGDAAADQAAWLFAQACLAGAGQPGDLRAWAGRRRLPVLPARLAAGFAGAGRPATVFDAGTAAGRMVLVSADDGACQVVVERATQASAETALVRVLGLFGVTAAPVFAKADREEAVALRMYRAAGDGGRWLVSVGSVGDRYAAGLAAEVRLSAVVDPAAGD